VGSSKVISAAGGPSSAAGLSADEAVGVLRSLMSNVPGAIYRVTFEDGLSLRLIGDEIERITGYPPEDFVDAATRTLFSIVHPDDRAWVERELRAVREHAQDDLAAGATARRSLTIEYRIVRADAEVRWVLERGTTVRDQDGRICLDGVIFDVTERHEAEERLRRREAEAAQARELRASRSRIVAAADDARRRLERDLHDGAQQRFVSAALMVQLARRRAADAPEVAALLQEVAREIESGLSDLRELAHGIHPAVLTDEGAAAAFESLAEGASTPLRILAAPEGRFAPAAETAAYLVVAAAVRAGPAQVTAAQRHLPNRKSSILNHKSLPFFGRGQTAMRSSNRSRMMSW